MILVPKSISTGVSTVIILCIIKVDFFLSTSSPSWGEEVRLPSAPPPSRLSIGYLCEPHFFVDNNVSNPAEYSRDYSLQNSGSDDWTK